MSVVLYDAEFGRPLVWDEACTCLRLTTDQAPEPTRFPTRREAQAAIDDSVATYTALGVADGPERYVDRNPRLRRGRK